MSKVQIKQGIHKVSNNNLVLIRETRKQFAKKQFNELLKGSKHIIIIALDSDDLHKMYSTMNTKELIYSIETCKAMLLSDVSCVSKDII